MKTVFVQTKVVHCETTRGTGARQHVTDAETQWRWLARPVARARGWHSGLIEINAMPYRAECTFVESDGHHWQVIDLAGIAGQHYRITIGEDGVICSCPHATYRSVVCKHAASIVSALEDQERWERENWSAALERETAERRGVEVPF